MRMTVTLDAELVAKAREYTGIEDLPSLVNTALKALLERKAVNRLARLGGSEPGAKAPPRRRPKL